MIRLAGDEDARAQLGPTLTWAAERIDAAFAACAILSGRFEPVSRAWGWSSARADSIDVLLRAHLRDGLLATRQIVALGELLEGDPTLPTVFELGHGELTPGVVLLLERLELSMPHVLVLRSQGRVACLLMICRGGGTEAGAADANQALRRAQPLAEAAVDPDAVVERHPRAADLLVARGLTPREQTIAELAISGAGNSKIADELGIADTTVRNHMSRVLRKLGIRSRAELIAIYLAAERSGRTGT